VVDHLRAARFNLYDLPIDQCSYVMLTIYWPGRIYIILVNY
jgi:hypothetical protein